MPSSFECILFADTVLLLIGLVQPRNKMKLLLNGSYACGIWVFPEYRRFFMPESTASSPLLAETLWILPVVNWRFLCYDRLRE